MFALYLDSVIMGGRGAVMVRDSETVDVSTAVLHTRQGPTHGVLCTRTPHYGCCVSPFSDIVLRLNWTSGK